MRASMEGGFFPERLPGRAAGDQHPHAPTLLGFARPITVGAPLKLRDISWCDADPTQFPGRIDATA